MQKKAKINTYEILTNWINTSLSRLIKFFKLIGINPRQIRSLQLIPRYVKDCLNFTRKGGLIDAFYPILTDLSSQAGTAKGHYFHQDLLVASYIHKNSPIRHIDVGSRIDGFVAHVACFRKIDVLDVRPLSLNGHENITVIQKDLSQPSEEFFEISDSVSCLHALEHFGLGRYGDPIDPMGHIKGFNNLTKMLKPNGRLYISVPISNKTSTQFNAHRIFNPTDILGWSNDRSILELLSFDYVDDAGELHRDVNCTLPIMDIYGCGIYTFKKLKVSVKAASSEKLTHE
jgi:hypothetical protein